jgi:hypothetical protein
MTRTPTATRTPGPDQCARLLPYATHETHSAGGFRCGRPIVDMDGPDAANQQARCAVHRGVDKRTETNRQRAATRRRLLARRPSIDSS